MKNYPIDYAIKVMGKKSDFEGFGGTDDVLYRRINNTGGVMQ
jgi:hypothetical protein